VCATPYKGAESHHHLHIEVVEKACESARVGLPAEVGLLPGDQDQIVVPGGNGKGPGHRPGEAAGAAVVDLHLRATHLEVVELLGLYHRKRFGQVQRTEEKGGRSRGGIAGVVPSLPGQQGTRGP
jgi:hypothetical protein